MTLSGRNRTASAVGGFVAAGAGAAAYAMTEARRYRLERRQLVLGSRCPEMSILHISDTHLGRHNMGLATWLRSLPDRIGDTLDMVVATGDLIDDDSGITPLVDALGALQARAAKYYVLGSHDYYSSSLRGFVKGAANLYSRSRAPVTTRRTDVDRLTGGLASTGWLPLLNKTEIVRIHDRRVRVAGIDDPFLRRHRTDHIARTPADDLALALVHTPDVVSEWLLAGFDLVFSGHTHGGQIRLPAVGAVVTNCSLPSGLAGGLHPVGAGWIHVSPGLGTSKFSRVRFLCPPEATLLELRPGEQAA
ncbi:MAG: metallophosphoesterase [Actinomycetota bacterium]|nr:metallophosphoesterase [Actinomycetota bacterium]